jgi:hypothetical protein
MPIGFLSTCRMVKMRRLEIRAKMDYLLRRELTIYFVALLFSQEAGGRTYQVTIWAFDGL